MFNPITSSTDFSTLTAEQIIAQRQKIMEEQRLLDIALKAKMEEQRAGFVRNVAEQIQALDILPADFFNELKQMFKVESGSYYQPKEVFDTIPKEKLEEWFSDFNELKNKHIRSAKTPFFKLAKKTVAGISKDKYSTIFFEDIKGGDKGIQAIAKKIAPTRDEAMEKLFDTVKKDDPRIQTVMDMLYPSSDKKAPAKKTTK